MTNKVNNEEINQDISKILDILHQVPEEKIPEHFELSLQKTLQEEGRKIKTKKNRKLFLRAVVSLAACFAIGIASISMYNSGIGMFSIDDSAKESASEEIKLFMEDGATENQIAKRDTNSSKEKFEDKSEDENERYGFAATMADEDTLYIELIDQYVGHKNYQIVSKSKDSDTGQYIFELLILKDGEGNPVNETIVLIGDEGEIYEQKSEEQSFRSD
ncbi:MAG: hypothetical protein PHE41_06040 [Eubacteriales bacterium]|nr:hypothetical protein [Eubacteriales bacterium]